MKKRRNLYNINVEKQFDINEFDKEEPEIDDEIGM